MHIILTGAGGMLALDLIQQLSQTEWKLTALSRNELDITNPKQVHSSLEKYQPDVLINCAAYTNVDGAETHKTEANLVNADAAGILAECCKKQNTKLVHISTDFVFDGCSKSAYTEDHPTAPIGVYGNSKLAGEKIIKNSGADFLIVRTSWLYGTHGRNFVKTMLRLTKEQQEVRVVCDQTGSPTWTQDLADALIRLIQCDAKGIVHFSNSGQCSWYDLAKKTLELGQELGVISCSPALFPIPTSEFPTLAKRPCFSVLDSALYQKITQKTPPPWQETLRRMIECF